MLSELTTELALLTTRVESDEFVAENSHQEKMTLTGAETPEMTYSIVWCRTSHNRYLDGVLTHAVANDQPGGWAGPVTLCGVKWSDSGWREVGPDDRPGCMRCAAALRKIKVITE